MLNIVKNCGVVVNYLVPLFIAKSIQTYHWKPTRQSLGFSSSHGAAFW
jgi:hypothetical protein